MICDDNTLTVLRCMSQHVRKIVENAFAELQHVVAPSLCREIRDNVISEIRCKHEGVRGVRCRRRDRYPRYFLVYRAGTSPRSRCPKLQPRGPNYPSLEP
jgi:hypothetical protein